MRIRPITPEVESLLDLPVADALAQSRISKVTRFTAPLVNGTRRDLQVGKSVVQYKLEPLPLPSKKGIELYLFAKHSEDERRAVMDSSFYQRMFESHMRVYPQMPMDVLVEIFQRDNGQLLNAILGIGATSTNTFTSESLSLISSNWMLDQPLGFDELCLIRDSMYELFDWHDISMREFVFLVRRNRRLPQVASQLDHNEFDDWVEEISDWRKHVKDDSVFAWTMLPFPERYRYNEEGVNDIPQFGLAKDYSYDEVAPYVEAGVTDVTLIRSSLQYGIDAEVAVSLVSA